MLAVRRISDTTQTISNPVYFTDPLPTMGGCIRIHMRAHLFSIKYVLIMTFNFDNNNSNFNTFGHNYLGNQIFKYYQLIIYD